MGEVMRHREQAQDKLRACAGVQTPGGKVQVRWDGPATAATVARWITRARTRRARAKCWALGGC